MNHTKLTWELAYRLRHERGLDLRPTASYEDRELLELVADYWYHRSELDKLDNRIKAKHGEQQCTESAVDAKGSNQFNDQT